MLNGSREFFGLLFVIPVIRFMLLSKDGARFARSVDTQLKWFLVVQAFAVTYQFIKYGANDHGGGTFGYGGSGQVSSLIYMVSYYLVMKNWDSGKTFLRNLHANRWWVLLLYPTFLNETKVSFVFLVVYFMTLTEINRHFIFRTIKVLPVMILVIVGAGWVYFATTPADADEMMTVEFFDSYLVGQDIDEIVEKAIMVQDEGLVGESDFLVDVPRFGKVFLVPEALSHTKGGMWLGAGLGQFKGGNLVKKSQFASRYQWLLYGSVLFLFFVLIQLGIVGVIWFAADVITAVFVKNTRSVYGINVSLYVLMNILISVIYNDQMRYISVCFLMFYLVMWGLQPAGDADQKLTPRVRVA